ncbi:hypothetical protein OE88DRAFT_1638057 [Heliocybe sulcata]|uniref:HSF-type DNA-binding domain-containing protein n=1 Tax=Heliocybe sulcata TaxID=5364 RepID=A0A5C3MNY1_9AGAM|nr:hypothetical protein OE88DRAFT_1638057 [Heliocybe sulcata]
MASDQQVALARTPRGSTSNLTKTARQVVPAFLQKLYEMVNDHSNNDLIRWSETGDSFFVLDHDRFAKEVLGRWFKHQNFSSFVRQLNMYGFHKIPHLQQGVLKSDADTEFWNFEHPNFRCGQPDLLCLIQRKKQAQPSGTEDHLLETARDPSNPAATNGPLSAGQLLDINTVVNGIAAIKRHQTAISDDLNVLKTSNEQLWQEAIASRERHQKQQDTINRILKFLAGVFGQQGAPKHDGSQTPPAMMPRKRQRLMIGDMDRIAGKTRAAEVADVDEEDEEMPLRSPASTDRGHSPFSGSE